MSQAAGIGFSCHHTKTGCAEEILCHRAPQIPNGLQRGVLFLLNKRLGIEVKFVTQGAQKLGCAVQADGRLEVGCFQRFAELAAVLAVQANVCVGVS